MAVNIKNLNRCDICGKNRGTENHSRCSKLRQQQYKAENTRKRK